MGKDINEMLLMAYTRSWSEYYELCKKFPAWASLPISDRAKKQGVKRGYSLLRTIGKPNTLFAVDPGSFNRPSGYYSDGHIGETRSFQLVYEPQSEIVKSMQTEEHEAALGRSEEGQCYTENYKSSAPIVKFAGNKYIWINKEECEAGKDKYMHIYSAEITELAEPVEDCHYDYGVAIKLRNQNDRIAFQNATAEELAMVIPVEMSSEDDYSKVTPAPEKQIAGLANLYRHGVIDIDKFVSAMELAQYKQGVFDGTIDNLALELRDAAKQQIISGKDEDVVKSFAEVIKKLLDAKAKAMSQIQNSDEQKVLSYIDGILAENGIKIKGE